MAEPVRHLFLNNLCRTVLHPWKKGTDPTLRSWMWSLSLAQTNLLDSVTTTQDTILSLTNWMPTTKLAEELMTIWLTPSMELLSVCANIPTYLNPVLWLTLEQIPKWIRYTTKRKKWDTVDHQRVFNKLQPCIPRTSSTKRLMTNNSVQVQVLH